MMGPAVRECDHGDDLLSYGAADQEQPPSGPAPSAHALIAPPLDLASPSQRLAGASAGSMAHEAGAGAAAQHASVWAQLSPAARAVIAFHVAFDLPRQSCPSVDVDSALVELRVRLLEEEVDEFAAAARCGDLAALADALGDIVYVAYGAAVTYGLDLDAILAEVHRSNMSKLDADGRPVLRDDGKVLKSDRYRPPDVASVIGHQAPLPGG